MDSLMMDFQLTLPTLLRRAETYFGEKETVSYTHLTLPTTPYV